MIDLSEIKKLSIEGRLKIIEELWQSIDDSELPSLSAVEETNLVQERLELYEAGKMKFTPWDVVKERIKKR